VLIICNDMKKGFTLMELLIVMSIIAIITAIGLVSYAPINRRSRDAKRKSDLEQVRSALEMYRSDNGYYPTSSAASFSPLTTLDPGDGNGPLVSTYLPSIPMDPKNTTATLRTYYYIVIGAGPDYYSYCLCSGVENTADGKNECGITPPAEITTDTTFTAAYCLRNP